MQKKFSIFAVSTTSLLSVALACGGSDGDKINIPDASTGGSGSADAAGVNCFVNPTHAPTFGSADQGAEYSGSGTTREVVWGAYVNADAMPDALQLELYAGIGAFQGTDIVPKAVTLSGAELNYKTCSVCVRLFADTTQDSVAAQYLATGGTVTLTGTTTNLTGTLSNITMEKVTVAQDYTSTPVGDGCTTTITSASFDAVLEMGSGSATAGNPNARVITLRRTR
jgi:hypothetical protein